MEISESEWEWLKARLDEPARDLPKLRELLNSPSPFEESE